MRLFVRKTMLMLLAVCLLIGAVPAVNYAADDTFKLKPVADATSKDVMVKGERKVIYCMQQKYIWPVMDAEGYANPTIYVEANDDRLLLTDKQRDVLKRVLYAGYPYNGKGFLDPVYEYYAQYEGGKAYADYEAAEITQNIVWLLMSEWNVPGNPEFDIDDLIKRDDIPMLDIINAIMLYAKGKELVNAPASSDIEVDGEAIFEEIDGLWETELMTVVNPENCVLTYELVLPEDITAVDADGNELTSVAGGEKFKLTTEDSVNVKDDAMLEVEAEFKYPAKLYQFDTTQEALKGGYYVPYQTMLCADVETVELCGSMPLTCAKNTVTEPGEDSDEETGLVDTSDYSPISLYASLLLSSVTAIVLFVRIRRKA
ncbi:MAG: thioester domain-containing protein [Firmicutes bacterium]|nr:thioester domain-containing protein [Bacillota bacterium]